MIEINKTRPRYFRTWLLGSLTLSLFAFWWGPAQMFLYEHSNDVPDPDAVEVSIWLVWLWIAVFVGALVRYRLKGLWLLVGAPFVLAWPYSWIFVARDGCSLFSCG